VPAAAVQEREAEARDLREALRAAEREARHLRAALAEALSSGADLPNALRELGVLRESTEAAARRLRGLEELNGQLEGRISQLEGQVARLRKGAVDLRSEEDLMREVIVQQSEHLVRRVEDLTDERTAADADRQQLLNTAAGLLAEVDLAEARLGRCPGLRGHCQQLESVLQALQAEVERLRRSNHALCQQVLGEEGEGCLTGALAEAAHLDVDEPGRALCDDFARLVHGQRPSAQPPRGGDVRTDAAALALRLQRLLAEREEAFWLERQRLSDRVLALERVRPGRAGGALRHYDAVARGQPAPPTGPGALVPSPAAAAAAVSGGLRKLRESLGA